MILNKEQQKEFEKASRPLMKFLGDNFHPHVKVIVGYSKSEFLEDITAFVTADYIKD